MRERYQSQDTWINSKKENTRRSASAERFFLYYSPNDRIYDRIVAVVRHPSFYYVFTTIGVPGLPRFAPFCLFCDKFNNPEGIYIPGKLRQNRAEYGILGGFSNMIKILFVCHGSILKSLRKASKINDFMLQSGTCYTTTTPFLKEP